MYNNYQIVIPILYRKSLELMGEQSPRFNLSSDLEQILSDPILTHLALTFEPRQALAARCIESAILVFDKERQSSNQFSEIMSYDNLYSLGNP